MSDHKFNLVPDPNDPRDYVGAPPTKSNVDALPDVYHIPSEIIPDIWNQLNLGSCTGHGNAAIFEIDRRKQRYAPLDPSRMFIYYNEREVEGTINTDGGANVRTGLKVMADKGVCKEMLHPYYVNTWKDKPSPAAYQDGLLRQVEQYTRLDGTVESAIAAIAINKAVVFGFSVYDSFEATGVGTVASDGIMRIPGSRENRLGGHCVCAIGYEITKRGAKHKGFFGWLLDRIYGSTLEGYLICRNSWGTSWGLGGYFKMPFEFVKNGNTFDFWIVDSVEA